MIDKRIPIVNDILGEFIDRITESDITDSDQRTVFECLVEVLEEFELDPTEIVLDGNYPLFEEVLKDKDHFVEWNNDEEEEEE